MTLQSSGAISMNDLVGEYGGSAPHALNEYYRGGSLVPSHSNTSGIPSSGTIQLDDFYGTSASSPTDNQVTFNKGTHTVIGSKFNDVLHGVDTSHSPAYGSWSDQSFTNSAGNTTFTMIAFFHTITTLASTASVHISGNYNNQTWNNVTGYTGACKQGSTLVSNVGGSTGFFNSNTGNTQFLASIQSTMPTGTVTITLS